LQLLILAKRDFFSRPQRGRAARKSQNVSRKGAKAAKFGQVRRYFSLRSWRLGAIKRIRIFGRENLGKLQKLSTVRMVIGCGSG
jgi:hypothetical protein